MNPRPGQSPVGEGVSCRQASPVHPLQMSHEWANALPDAKHVLCAPYTISIYITSVQCLSETSIVGEAILGTTSPVSSVFLKRAYEAILGTTSPVSSSLPSIPSLSG